MVKTGASARICLRACAFLRLLSGRFWYEYDINQETDADQKEKRTWTQTDAANGTHSMLLGAMAGQATRQDFTRGYSRVNRLSLAAAG
ncbi:MAG: hypothetical protein HZA50_08520 [Planctomycetes bacterium]|nr:hypothetical protein [Planctomycetota bacterium]